MERKHNYKIRDVDEIPDKLKDFYREIREEFKEHRHRISYKFYLNASECFNTFTNTPDAAQVCLGRSFDPIDIYEQKVKAIWTKGVERLQTCVDACGPKDSECLSACFGRMTKDVHANLVQFHKLL
eukprot:TRINITY_DN5392_c0_g2_i5.p2 TRINITY_DN5392_c0_g2~~TRINITY_DN5392_c0_g2_i5.p2  ORF type:complete len:126 (-),score=36.76 TRINITY_DN5392_c0_g2_i5:77-454(-)